MQEKLERVNHLINEVEQVYLSICEEEGKGFEHFRKITGDISAIIEEMLKYSGRLSELGVDIPNDILIQQVSNLAESCERRDSVMLADTLYYEIKETLAFYVEILQEMIKENLSL